MREAEGALKAEMAIAQMADELRVAFLAQMMALMAMWHPSLPIFKWYLSEFGGTHTDFPFDVTGTDGVGIRFSAREVMTAVTQLSSAQLRQDLVAGPMLIGATRLGDAIVRGGFSSKESPLMQFARHFRNACAHGDRWNFRGNEPRYTAATREITLDKAMHGQRATWTTVVPHDYVLFLDQVHAHFAQLAFWSATDATFERAKGTTEDNVRVVLGEELAARGIVVTEPTALRIAVSVISLGYEFRLPVQQREYGPAH